MDSNTSLFCISSWFSLVVLFQWNFITNNSSHKGYFFGDQHIKYMVKELILNHHSTSSSRHNTGQWLMVNYPILLVLQPRVLWFNHNTTTSFFLYYFEPRMHISEPPTIHLQATLSLLTEKTNNVQYHIYIPTWYPLYSFPPKPTFPFFSSFVSFLSIIILFMCICKCIIHLYVQLYSCVCMHVYSYNNYICSMFVSISISILYVLLNSRYK